MEENLAAITGTSVPEHILTERRICKSIRMKVKSFESSSRIELVHHHAVFSTLHRGTPLATSIEATSSDRLGWVGVYPLDLEKPLTREFIRHQGIEISPPDGRAYRVRSFEVSRSLIEADASIGETELENQQSVIVFSDAALVAELEKLGVMVESLELPYKSNYPI